MRSLSELLLTYHIPGVRASEIRRICAEEIAAVTGYQPTSKQLSYKNESMFLSIPPIVKSALVLKQKELATRLMSRGVTLKGFK